METLQQDSWALEILLLLIVQCWCRLLQASSFLSLWWLWFLGLISVFLSMFWAASNIGVVFSRFGWLRILCKCSCHLFRLSTTWDNLTSVLSLTGMFPLLYPTASVFRMVYSIFSFSFFWIQGSPLLLLSLSNRGKCRGWVLPIVPWGLGSGFWAQA